MEVLLLMVVVLIHARQPLAVRRAVTGAVRLELQQLLLPLALLQLHYTDLHRQEGDNKLKIIPFKIKPSTDYFERVYY